MAYSESCFVLSALTVRLLVDVLEVLLCLLSSSMSG